MLVVETVAKVRRLHFVQGLAIKAICRELGLRGRWCGRSCGLARRSFAMQSLQIRQQLGATALSAANTAPQFLLSLFR
jgi:hypothetical protein